MQSLLILMFAESTRPRSTPNLNKVLTGKYFPVKKQSPAASTPDPVPYCTWRLDRTRTPTDERLSALNSPCTRPCQTARPASERSRRPVPSHCRRHRRRRVARTCLLQDDRPFSDAPICPSRSSNDRWRDWFASVAPWPTRCRMCSWSNF